MGEAKRRKALDPNYGKVAILSKKQRPAYSEDPRLELVDLLSQRGCRVTIISDKEKKRLIEVIKDYIKNNLNLKGWVFPSDSYNFRNLSEAALEVQKMPEFADYYYTFNEEPKDGFKRPCVIISKEPYPFCSQPV